MTSMLACFASLLLCLQSAAPPAQAPRAQQPQPAAPAATQLHAEVTTTKGKFSILLHDQEAPMSCANFINLVKRNYYNNQAFDIWTRVVRQASGPIGLNSAGYGLKREFAANLRFDRPGRVALQRLQTGEQVHPTNFFVTTKSQERWDLDMPIFGTVDSGQAVVDLLMKGDRIERIEIQGDPAELLKKYESDIAQWNKHLDAAIKAAQARPPEGAPTTPPATPPATTPPTSPPANPPATSPANPPKI